MTKLCSRLPWMLYDKNLSHQTIDRFRHFDRLKFRIWFNLFRWLCFFGHSEPRFFFRFFFEDSIHSHFQTDNIPCVYTKRSLRLFNFHHLSVHVFVMCILCDTNPNSFNAPLWRIDPFIGCGHPQLEATCYFEKSNAF